MKIYHKPESIILCDGYKWFRGNSVLNGVEIFFMSNYTGGFFTSLSSISRNYFKQIERKISK